VKIQAILTDIGNVLVTFNRKDWLLEGIGRYLNFRPKELMEIIQPELDGLTLDVALNTDRTRVSRLWKKIVSYVESQGGTTVISYPVFYAFWTGHLRPVLEVVALFLEIQKRFPIIAVTDGNRDGADYLLPLLSDFHGLNFERVFLSATYGACKPQLFKPAVEYLLQTARSPKECLYIDDVEANLVAARALGFQTIQFDASRQLATDLEERLGSAGILQVSA